jgi:hypothetical protein
MKPFAKILCVSTAALLACLNSAKAQLVTYETISAYDGSSITGFGTLVSNSTRGETFTNIEAISSLTYNFFKAGTNSTSASFSAVFSEWNAGNSTWSTLQNFGSFTVPASTSWGSLTNTNGTFATFAQTFSFGSLLITDPTKTYALLLTNTTGTNTNFGIGTVFDSFTYGSTAVIDGGNDYTFSQIVVVPGGNTVPVPEPATIASLFAATFVVGLVSFRVRQRRQGGSFVAVA